MVSVLLSAGKSESDEQIDGKWPPVRFLPPPAALLPGRRLLTRPSYTLGIAK